MAEDAGLFFWEVLTPGRVAAGERFAYAHVGIDLEIWAGEQPLALERLELEPDRYHPDSSLRWGPYAYVATLYVCRVGWPGTQWTALEQTLAQWAQHHSTPGETVWGVSTLPAHGLVSAGAECEQQAAGRGADRTLVCGQTSRLSATCPTAAQVVLKHKVLSD